MEFVEQIERSPPFAKEFIKRVGQEFNDTDCIAYTKYPDMRIRKIKGKLNAMIIRWQPRKERFFCLQLHSVKGTLNYGGSMLTVKSRAVHFPQLPIWMKLLSAERCLIFLRSLNMHRKCVNVGDIK